MASRVLVTGMGIISAIGEDVSSNHISLRSGKTGIGKASILQSKYTDSFSFGEVPHTTESLKKQAGIPEEK